MRGGVQRLLDEAQRLPEMPPMPVNYDDLLADIRQWLAALEGCQADVAAAQQAAVQQAADSATQLAAADEAADPERWHRLSWLSQQHPLVEERLQGLGGKLEAMPAAAASLQGLVRLIEEDKVGGLACIRMSRPLRQGPLRCRIPVAGCMRATSLAQAAGCCFRPSQAPPPL